MTDIVIVAAARTAVGKFGGSLADTRVRPGRHGHQGLAASHRFARRSSPAR